jgi:hypothetical protein
VRIIDLRLVCSGCQCRAFDMYLFARVDEIEPFMRGNAVEPTEDF